ncbi:MAG: hypothetical protein CMH87_08775 [Oceanibulbus sp.]|nr:hypothetical protein [Sulfitobacter sp.]
MFIDDATSTLMELRFVKSESTFSGVVTLTRRICKLASCSLIKRPVPRISTPRMLRADGSGW